MVKKMPYNNKFVLNAVLNGQIVPDRNGGNIVLPFGCEYGLRLRNRHNRRAVVKVEIDGEDISGGGWIIPANSFIDVDRPVNVSKKFKFVSLTSEDAADFGKDGPNYGRVNGTVTASFSLEEEHPAMYCGWTYPHTGYHYPYPSHDLPWQQNTYSYGCDVKSRQYVNTLVGSASAPSGHSSVLGPVNMNSTAVSQGNVSTDTGLNSALSVNDSAAVQDGCTVEGSDSDQKFSNAYIKIESNATIVKMFLRGYNPDDVIPKVKLKSGLKSELKSELKKVKAKPDTQDESRTIQSTSAKTTTEVLAETIEAENEALRLKIANLENAQLKKRLASLELAGQARNPSD